MTEKRAGGPQAGRRIRRRSLISSVALGAAGLSGAAFLGCGSSTQGPKSAAPSGSTQKSPKPGGKIALHVSADPYSWDTSIAGKSAPNGEGLALAYETLVGFKQGPDTKYGEIVVMPRLASKWETPDGQTYTFQLRPGLKFSPLPPANSRELTADDVKWSYEFATRTGGVAGKKLPQGQFDWFFEGVESIQAPSASTVVVRFKQPFVPFLNYAGSEYNPILPHEVYDQDGNFQDRIVGSGPFQLDPQASQKGTRWVWTRNPNYWDSGKPYIDQVDWLVIRDTPATVAAFRTKQLDWLGHDILGFEEAAKLKKDEPAAVQYSYLKGASLLHLNVSRGPLSDPRVRQALGYAIDRDEFIKSLDGGVGGWGLAGAFPDTFSQEETKQIVHFDLQKSKQLLSAAGYSSGLDFDCPYPGHDYGDTYIAALQLLQAQLKKVGMNLSLRSVDKNDFNSAKRLPKYDLILSPKSAIAGDVDSFLYADYYSTSKANYNFNKDPKLDAMLDAQRREFDAAKRQQLIRDAVRYINEQGFGFGLDSRTGYEFWHPGLRQYAPQHGVLRVPLAESWLSR